MVLVNKNLEGMLKEIDFQAISRDDTIIPMTFQGCPKQEEIPELSDVLCDFVRQIYHGDEELASYVTERTGKQWGARLIAVAIENAVLWGNHNNPHLPVTIKAYEGRHGLIVQVQDSGKGFDYATKIDIVKSLKDEKRLDKHGVPDKKERKYYTRKGGGFSTYEGVSAQVSFEATGNTINIMYLFDGSKR
jgi:hypothetical protein